MKTPSILLAAALAFSLGGCSLLGESDPLSAGIAAYEEHDYRAARISLANAMNAEGADPRAAEYYARTLLELGDGEGAERVLAMLAERADPPADLAALSAHAALLRGDFDRAIALGDAAADFPLARWVAIQARGEKGDFAEALNHAEEALEAFPDDARLIAQRGAMAISEGRIGAAKEYSERALAAGGDNLEALLLAGQLRLLRGDHSGAREFYSRANDTYPASTTALFAIAAVEADLGNHDAAAAHLEEILQVAPGHPLALLLQARLAYVEGDLDRAQDIVQSAEANIGAIPQGRLLMGELAYLRGFPAQAIVHLEDFLGSYPGHYHATTVLARALAETGQEAEAWALVEPLADSATAPPQMLALASGLAQQNGVEDRFAARLASNELPADFAERARAAQDALEADRFADADRLYTALVSDGGEQLAVIRNNAALAALGAGRKSAALSHARAAHELAPRDPRVRDTLGWVMLENGQAAPALAHLTAAVEGQPGNLQIRWHYANALLANGRNAQARRVIAEVRPFVSGPQADAMDDLLARI